MNILLVKKESTWSQTALHPERYARINDYSMALLSACHAQHETSVGLVLMALEKLGLTVRISSVSQLPVDPVELIGTPLILTVGGDGTFLSTSHIVGADLPILAINSDPNHSLGRFCHHLPKIDSAKRAISKALENPKITPVTRMSVAVDGRIVANRVLNEALFSHTCPAAMTRVQIPDIRPSWARSISCSGMWIGTGAGSTGAIGSAGGKKHGVRWKKLQAVIREVASDVDEICRSAREFTYISKTAEAALFMDGPFLRVPVGYDQKMEFSISNEPLALIAP